MAAEAISAVVNDGDLLLFGVTPAFYIVLERRRGIPPPRTYKVVRDEPYGHLSRSRKTPCIFGGIHTCTPKHNFARSSER